MIFFVAVKTKADNFEDTYGDIGDTPNEEDVQNDDDYGIDTDDTEQDPNEIIRNENYKLEMLTKPQVFVSKIGDTVWLPCFVSVAATGRKIICHRCRILYEY